MNRLLRCQWARLVFKPRVLCVVIAFSFMTAPQAFAAKDVYSSHETTTMSLNHPVQRAENPALVRVKTENTELCWFAINQLVSTISVSHQAFEEQTAEFAAYLQFRSLLAKHLERALAACHDVRDNSVIMPILTRYRRELVGSIGYFHVLQRSN